VYDCDECNRELLSCGFIQILYSPPRKDRVLHRHNIHLPLSVTHFSSLKILRPVRLRLKIRSLRPAITVWSVSRSSLKVPIVKFSISRFIAFLLLVLVEWKIHVEFFELHAFFLFSVKTGFLSQCLILLNELYEVFYTMIVFDFFSVIFLGFAWLGLSVY
jgi:hypothetical protein